MRSMSSSPLSENKHARAIAAVRMSSHHMRSLQGTRTYTTVPLSSVSRTEGSLCWNMVVYGKHLASKSRLIHSMPSSLTAGNCREALAIGKDVKLMLLRNRVTSFKFFGTMAFFPQLPWLLFPLHWRHKTGWDLTLFSWVPGESSLWRVGDGEESAKLWWALVGFIVCQWRGDDGYLG